jgi:fucose permease
MHPNKSEPSQATNFARWNLIFGYASLFCYGLADNIRGPVYPEILAQFGLSHSTGSWFFALASVFSMLGGSSIAWFLRRSSYLRMFHVGMILLLVSQICFARAPSFAMALVGSVLFGTASGFLGVLQNVLVLVAGTGPRLTKWMNGLHANYGLSSLLAPLIVSAMSFLTADYRAGFWCVAAATAIVFVASFRVPGFQEPVRDDSDGATGRWSVSLVTMALAFSLYVMAEVLMGTRIAQFTREYHGADLRSSGAWTSLFFVGLFAGRMIFAFFHPGWPVRRQLAVGLLLSTGLGIGGLCVSPWFFGVMGLTMGPCYPLAMSLVSEIFLKRLAFATQVCVTSTYVLLVLMHVAVGELCDRIGTRNALLMAPAGLLVAILLIFALPPARRVPHA